MKGNFEERVEKPLSMVSGILIGDNLMPAIKGEMLKQKVFRMLFGERGERIFTDKLPNYNDTIIPLIEFYWADEMWQSQHTRISGSLKSDIVLPADLLGRTDRFRQVGAAFARWIESNHDLFKRVSGLIEFGTNLRFDYSQALRAGGDFFPVINMRIPIVFDLHVFQQENPEIDLGGALDADLFGWIESYNLKITDDDENVLSTTTPLSKTGQING